MVLGATLLQVLALIVLAQLGTTCLHHKCPGRPKLVDLGRGYYPRYIATLACEPVYCLPHYCSELTYNVKVLRKRDDDERHDGSLPASLQEAWRFVYVTVAVGCTCKIHNGHK